MQQGKECISVDLTQVDFSEADDLSQMFFYCKNLKKVCSVLQIVEI